MTSREELLEIGAFVDRMDQSSADAAADAAKARDLIKRLIRELVACEQARNLMAAKLEKMAAKRKRKPKPADPLAMPPPR